MLICLPDLHRNEIAAADKGAQSGFYTRTSFDLKRGAFELPAFLFVFGIKEEFT